MPNEKKPKTECVEYLRHAEYYDMQSTFDELYARSQAGEIFENLMDVILFKRKYPAGLSEHQIQYREYYAGNRQAEDF